MRNSVIIGGLILLGLGACSQQGEVAGGGDIMMDADDIAGVVTGPNGPEAGAWVIAETDDLPTKFIRTVITDDQGRYLIPDLPDANFQVWARPMEIPTLRRQQQHLVAMSTLVKSQRPAKQRRQKFTLPCTG